ncbi:MAG TPA: hypothetical protein VD789_09210, partial [Thermomicrobiales bacterium]|nr:hypothetical protein [Thermomicrobiales bacterium]
MTDSTSATERYQARIDRFTGDHRAIEQRWSMLANLRLVLFVALGIALWQWYAGDSAIAGWLTVLVAVVLVPIIVVHRRLRRERDRLARLIRVNERGRDRASLAWDSNIPQSPIPAPPPEHPYARDLNVVGTESLVRRIGTPVTVAGWRTLQRWLLEPAPVGTVRQRQPAVCELGDAIDLRQDVEQAGIEQHTDPGELEELLAWAEGERVLEGRSWLVVLAWVGPLAVLALGAAHLLGQMQLPL